MQSQPAARLDGTSWQLVELRSPNSASIVRPGDPTKYELTFGADGSLAMLLDCNRGTGRWSAEPQAIAYGQITITGGAMTRAMCPPGSLDTRIAQEIGNVRTYSIQGDRLTLALASNGGSQIWSHIP
jgi:heat shock protein HslJ